MAKKNYSQFAKTASDGGVKTRSLSELNTGMYDIKAPYRGSNNEARLADVEIHKLVDFQGETPFEDYMGTEKFNTLVRDIDENGILSRVVLRELADGTYEILAGRHRTAAARYLRHATVPAVIWPVGTSDSTAMMIHLTTNLMNGRDKMRFIEVVRAVVAYEATLENLKGKRSDRQENGEKYDRYQHLADVFGIGNRTTVIQYLRAGREMPEDILHLVDAEQLPFTVANKIMAQPEGFREELFAYVRQGNKLTISELDNLIEADKKKKTEPVTEQVEEPIQPVVQEVGSAFEGFQPLEDVQFETKEEHPEVVVNTEKADKKEDKSSEPKKEGLKVEEFGKVINTGKKKKTITMKLDKELVPARFTSLEDDKKQALIIFLLKRWDDEFQN